MAHTGQRGGAKQIEPIACRELFESDLPPEAIHQTVRQLMALACLPGKGGYGLFSPVWPLNKMVSGQTHNKEQVIVSE